MKCDECAPLLEDFLYHKLDTSSEKTLAEHLPACDSCAREYALLRKEQALYTRDELEVSPDFWAGVQSRIASEQVTQTPVGLFNAFRLVPVVAAVTCLLIVVGSIGLWRRFASQSDRPVTAEVQNAPQQSVPTTQKSVPESDSPKSDGTLVDAGPRDGSRRRRLFSDQIDVDSPGVSRAYPRKIEKPQPDTNGVEQNSLTQVQRSVRSDLDADSARHVEQVEMLLRSVKNSRFLRDSHTLDITYESRLSKDLLARNVLLRRDAELAGNVPLTRLLDRFEPFLVDIANLRDSDSKEIHQIRESLTKAEILAAVHFF